MTLLESYLQEAYKNDGIFLNRLLSTIDEVIPVFYKRKKSLNDGGTTWSYAISKEPEEEEKPFSASTHSMILFALDAFIPRSKNMYSLLLGKNFRACKISEQITEKKKLQEVILAAKRTLVNKIRRNASQSWLVNSSTYGANDPFTLTWLAEIVFRWTGQSNVSEREIEEWKRDICQAAIQALDRDDILETEEKGNLKKEEKRNAFGEVESSFLKVRRLYLAKAIERFAKDEMFTFVRHWLELKTPELWKDFDTILHRQLSYSKMGDPRFDPSELAFAFEGALLLHSVWINNYTVDAVFEALKLSRNPYPYWRPTAPFLANERGHIVFPISIEVANSILRSCEILDEEDERLTRFAQFEPQLRNYATWLFGEVEEIAHLDSDEYNLVGWRTEYEAQKDIIQLWHTSHVLVFLTQYASLLKRKIAADGIEAAGLQVYKPKIIKGYWDDEPLSYLSIKKNPDDPDRPYAVLGRIKKQYIEPRQNSGNQSNIAKTEPLYSMLLYGPPGTGKTTVAEQLAVTLKQPLIVITVSDFLAAGAAAIENRAKGIFQILQAQEDVVILFDEIDQFLLDRNSKLYQRQADVFKFMTPGMLTKLQNLRDAKNCIFIIATNYYERIDSAIKRRGRIDEHFLLCIPDKQQRLKILERFALSKFGEKLEDGATRKKYAEAAAKGEERYFFEVVAGYLLRTEHIKDFPSLAAKLRNSKDSPEDLSYYLLNQLSTEARYLLEQEDSSSSEQLWKLLVDELNELLQKPSLFEKQRFSKVNLKKETTELTEKKLEGKDLIQLNRTLLTEAYPDEIAEFSKGFNKQAFEKALKLIPAATVLFGWGDLKNLVESRTEIKKGMNLKSFAEALLKARDGIDAAVTLNAYRNRFKGNDPLPFEEFFLLLYLVAEVNKADEGFSITDRETISQILSSIPDFKGEKFDKLNEEKSIKDQDILKKFFEAWEKRQN